MEIIVAITDNFVIGANGSMPWHLPADLSHFKEITSGNTIVMGRQTWDSIGRALPNRVNVVITRQEDFDAVGATVVHSLEEIQNVDTIGTIFVIGGGEIYKSVIDKVNRLHITRIHTTVEGDTHFPRFEETEWVLSASTPRPRDEHNAYDLTFETWSRAQ
ncbi:MAG: dihydrofolate reductase [Planctomycetes bacterium]|nr:dihydrofolate reductase [Planctomycetota bacterium]